MARQPFFGRGPGPAIARMDMNAATAPGRAYGQMFANVGSQIGGMIKEYGLNKEKRAELTGEIEAMLPQYMDSFTSTGNEADDKKNFQRLEKFSKGDMSMADLKGLAGELAMKDKVHARNDARLAGELNRKLLNQEFKTKSDIELLKKQDQDRKNKAYTSLISRGEELRKMVNDGVIEYDNLNSISKRIYNDIDLFRTRQVDPDKYAFSTEEEAQAELDKLEAEKLTSEIEGKELELTEKTAEVAKMPEFTDKASALASVKDLPEGVSASFKKFKDGFDVELQYKAKEFTDIPSVPGFPNYKKVGGFLYEADPEKKTLRKLDPEDFGEKSELLQNTIKTLTTKDVEQYGLAKFRGVRNDDGDYDVEDPASGETITIPFNQDLENRLIYLDGLRNKLKTQIDLDLTIR